MKAVIYTKPDCVFCTKAKALLSKKEIPYEEKTLDVDFNREDLLLLAPNARSFPQIWLDGELIGGHSDLVAHFGEQN